MTFDNDQGELHKAILQDEREHNCRFFKQNESPMKGL